MKQGDRIHLEGDELKAALETGMVEPHGTDNQGCTVYLLTRSGEILTGSGERNVGSTARKVQHGHPLIFGFGPTGLA